MFDLDIGFNKEFKFFIVYGDFDGYFCIDFDFGNLYVYCKFDREIWLFYFFKVRVINNVGGM